MRSVWAILAACLMMAGCKHSRPEKPSAKEADSAKPAQTSKKDTRSSSGKEAKTQPRLSPVSGPYGKVVAVRPNLQFVVIDFQLSQLPEINQKMSIFRNGTKVGELKISGPVRNSNVAADITAGDAQVGDEVRLN